MSSSSAIQASHALYQADVLQAESLQNYTIPRISLNAHAFALQQNSSIPLDHIKEQTAQHINTHFDHRFGSAPDGLLDALHDSTQTALTACLTIKMSSYAMMALPQTLPPRCPSIQVA